MAAPKTVIEVRDAMLTAAKVAYQNRGIASPNVGMDSDLFVRFDAIAEALAIPIASADNAAAEIWIDTCSDDAVLKHAKSVGLDLLTGTQASGSVVITLVGGVSSVSILDGAKLVNSATGNLYTMTTAGGTFTTGDLVSIVSDGYGEAQNILFPHSLQWSAPISGLSDFAQITPLGIIDGTDNETIESLRARTQDRIKHCVVGCNPQHLIEIAEATSNAVQKAFAYPALYGPGSGLLILQGDGTESNNWSRLITDDIVAKVAAEIVKVIPAEVNITVKSVAEETTNMILSLTIPLPPSGGGIGGGWIDAIPYPAPTATNAAYIGTMTSPVDFEILTTGNAPNGGESIAIWDEYTREFLHTTILSVVSATGTSHRVIVNKPVPITAASAWISPDAINIDAYILKLLESINKMGSGEATADPLRLPRSLRQPRKEVEYYHKLSSRLLSGLLSAYTEISDAEFTSSILVPTIPVISAPPNVITLGKFAIYSL